MGLELTDEANLTFQTSAGEMYGAMALFCGELGFRRACIVRTSGSGINVWTAPYVLRIAQNRKERLLDHILIPLFHYNLER